MVVKRRRPPTVTQLLALLRRVRVKTIRRFDEPVQQGEWRPDNGDSDLVGTIVIALDVDRQRGIDAAITAGIHELTHAFFQVNCRDDRVHHSRVYRWEGLLFRSRALREAMAVRIGNAAIYGHEEP
jgi:hypothetical protein